MWCVGFPMEKYNADYDDYFFFAKRDKVVDIPIVIDWDTIKETAFVLPELTDETIAAYEKGNDFVSYIVIPPRISWENIGWDHKFFDKLPKSMDIHI